MGGLTAALGPLYYPNVFYGGSAGAFSASIRRTMGEQFAWNYVGRRSGMGLDETSLTIFDTLEWATWFRQQGSDYFSSSQILRRRRGEQVHPLLYLVGDEDTVTCGVDWIPYLSGTRSMVERGASTVVQGSADFWWTIVDKRCHAEGGEFRTAIMNAPSTYTPDNDKEFVNVVYQHWLANHNGTFASYSPVPDDLSEDPYARFLTRGPQPVGPSSPFLHLDTSFGDPSHPGRTPGNGLTLGADESLKSLVINGQTYVYAGDADGIVHRFSLDPISLAFGEEARSTSLGYGAFALTIGKPDNTTTTVIVGTLRAMYQLDPLSLQIVRSTSLDFEHEGPRRIAIAEVFGSRAGKEILVTTFQGHLRVYDGLFNLITDLGEPGIQDFEVHEGADYSWATTSSHVPITLLSHRGHLANITLNDPAASPGAPNAELHCWTAGEDGGPGDLERVVMASSVEVVASYALDQSKDFPIKRFDALTLTPSAGGHLGKQQLPNSPGAYAQGWPSDIAAMHDAAGNLTGFAMLSSDRLSWVPTSGPARQILVSTFSPAHRAIAIHAADLEGDASEELVISTLTGHLVWLRQSEFAGTAGFQPWTLRPTIPQTSPYLAPPFPRTNHTLAGTWGMVWRENWTETDEGDLFPNHHIYAATQAGELYEVNPTSGASTLMADMRHLGEAPNPGGGTIRAAVVPESPIRDLAWVGDQVSGIAPGAQELFRWTSDSNPVYPPAPTGDWWLNTKPWQNKTSWYLTPSWYKDPAVVNGTYDAPASPELLVHNGFVPLTGSGAVSTKLGGDAGAFADELHWWGGSTDLFPNLVQGAYSMGAAIAGNWYTSADTLGVPNYGTGPAQCKDLRNMVADRFGTTYSLQSLRLGHDALGRVVVASTSGGSVVLLRPHGSSLTNHGDVLWSSTAFDDGYGVTALALRQVPGDTDKLDIFYGTCFGYPDPTQLPPADKAGVSSTIRWLRWDGSSTGGMTSMGILHLDPDSSDTRGGFAIAGLAVGDIIQDGTHPGAELVATTLAGDLYVLSIVSGTISSTPIVRAWVDAALGANNSILIEDMDMDLKNELYVASSQGIFKWRQ